MDMYFKEQYAESQCFLPVVQQITDFFQVDAPGSHVQSEWGI